MTQDLSLSTSSRILRHERGKKAIGKNPNFRFPEQLKLHKKQNSCIATNDDVEPLSFKKEKKKRKSEVGERKYELN